MTFNKLFLARIKSEIDTVMWGVSKEERPLDMWARGDGGLEARVVDARTDKRMQ